MWVWVACLVWRGFGGLWHVYSGMSLLLCLAHWVMVTTVLSPGWGTWSCMQLGEDVCPNNLISVLWFFSVVAKISMVTRFSFLENAVTLKAKEDFISQNKLVYHWYQSLCTVFTFKNWHLTQKDLNQFYTAPSRMHSLLLLLSYISQPSKAEFQVQLSPRHQPFTGSQLS